MKILLARCFIPLRSIFIFPKKAASTFPWSHLRRLWGKGGSWRQGGKGVRGGSLETACSHQDFYSLYTMAIFAGKLVYGYAHHKGIEEAREDLVRSCYRVSLTLLRGEGGGEYSNEGTSGWEYSPDIMGSGRERIPLCTH